MLPTYRQPAAGGRKPHHQHVLTLTGVERNVGVVGFRQLPLGQDSSVCISSGVCCVYTFCTPASSVTPQRQIASSAYRRRADQQACAGPYASAPLTRLRGRHPQHCCEGQQECMAGRATDILSDTVTTPGQWIKLLPGGAWLCHGVWPCRLPAHAAKREAAHTAACTPRCSAHPQHLASSIP